MINKSHVLNRMIMVVAVFAGSLSTPAAASVVFSDDTFDLTNYTIDTYQSGGATINTSQTLLNGNPGAALQTIITEPLSLSTFFTTQVFMNNSFIYDPGTQGAIQSIDASGDGYLFVQNLNGSLIRYAPAVISQNGNYYVSVITTPPVNGVWQSSSRNGLLATDFELVTNPLLQTTNPFSHPDFTSGAIQFGTTIFTFNPPIGGATWDIRVDNLSYTVNTVPIPPAIWLFGAGLLSLVGMARRKKTA
jgi:hypothetical protein